MQMTDAGFKAALAKFVDVKMWDEAPQKPCEEGVTPGIGVNLLQSCARLRFQLMIQEFLRPCLWPAIILRLWFLIV